MSDLSLSGTQIMMKLSLTYDILYDEASELTFPLDAFWLESDTCLASKLKTKLVIDESFWYKDKDSIEPIHEQNGLKIIYDDSKYFMISSGLTLQKEGYTFKDLMNLLLEFSNETPIKLYIASLVDDYYYMTIDKGKVTKQKVDLSNLTLQESMIVFYQVLILAGKNSIEETLKILD